METQCQLLRVGGQSTRIWFSPPFKTSINASMRPMPCGTHTSLSPSNLPKTSNSSGARPEIIFISFSSVRKLD
jgi:hypothetical protein